MKTLKELSDALDPVLELTGITKYAMIGSAAEFMEDLALSFGDVDILVTTETFKKLKVDGFKSHLNSEVNRHISRIGHVDIIEHDEKWIKYGVGTSNYPHLNKVDLIEFRIESGREKDQLKAWQMCHQLLQQYYTARRLGRPYPTRVSLEQVEKIVQRFHYKLSAMRK